MCTVMAIENLEVWTYIVRSSHEHRLPTSWVSRSLTRSRTTHQIVGGIICDSFKLGNRSGKWLSDSIQMFESHQMNERFESLNIQEISHAIQMNESL
jgi:hypothetical protein